MKYYHGTDKLYSAAARKLAIKNKPKRCANCRKLKKQQRRGKKKMFDAVCAKCGKQTQVPFNPTQGRDVLCKECFDAEKAASAEA